MESFHCHCDVGDVSGAFTLLKLFNSLIIVEMQHFNVDNPFCGLFGLVSSVGSSDRKSVSSMTLKATVFSQHYVTVCTCLVSTWQSSIHEASSVKKWFSQFSAEDLDWPN